MWKLTDLSTDWEAESEICAWSISVRIREKDCITNMHVDKNESCWDSWSLLRDNNDIFKACLSRIRELIDKKLILTWLSNYNNCFKTEIYQLEFKIITM